MGKVIDFTKMVGAGNDFIIIDNRAKVIKKAEKKVARRFCNRKYSVGADGLILLEKSKKADIRMRIFNPDGTEPEMCGNGVRCLAKFAVDNKIARGGPSIETLAGRIEAEVRGDIVKAKLVDPKGLRLNFEILVGGKKEILNFIDTGVPHAVMLVDSVAHYDVKGMGRAIRHHEHFTPRGTNVNFVSIRSHHAVNIRTYERGVEDETLACGTGSTAGALVAAALKGLTSPVVVYTRGGEVLKVYFKRKDSGFSHVYLEGKIQKSFEGRVNL